MQTTFKQYLSKNRYKKQIQSACYENNNCSFQINHLASSSDQILIPKLSYKKFWRVIFSLSCHPSEEGGFGCWCKFWLYLLDHFCCC